MQEPLRGTEVYITKRGDYFSLLSMETIYVKREREREREKNPASAEYAVTNTAKVCQRVTSSIGQQDRPWPQALRSVDTHKLTKSIHLITSLYNDNIYELKIQLIYN
jgi:hypothetical protein